ncbi:MAG: 4Fe-4S binding protein [Candidatus Caldarchaeum sp.]|nr:4Fe-4S binding protein [Candidatus Caldarchaeum sp.]
MVFETITRIIKPMVVAVKHIFMTPVTIKYPYERIVNTTGENYRYDPKAGIAYPGFKGRHLLYLDKCTGCSLCDIACQNVAEAIVMVYGFNVTVKFNKKLIDDYRKGEKTAVEFIESLIGKTVSKTDSLNQNSHPVLPVVWSDFKTLQPSADGFEWRMNAEPIYSYRSEAILEHHFQDFFVWLRSNGWTDTVFEVQGADKEDEYHRLSNGVYEVTLAVTKIDEKLAHNKKSYFPAVDYGRCVFCGLCVDACPFYALEMMPAYEISEMDRKSLFYNPKQLAKPSFRGPPAELGWTDKLLTFLRG